MDGWSYFIVLIISALVAVALAPKPPSPKPASIEDFDIPTAEQGREIPVAFGTVTVTGANVIWYGGLGTEEIVASGGKK